MCVGTGRTTGQTTRNHRRSVLRRLHRRLPRGHEPQALVPDRRTRIPQDLSRYHSPISAGYTCLAPTSEQLLLTASRTRKSSADDVYAVSRWLHSGTRRRQRLVRSSRLCSDGDSCRDEVALPEQAVTSTNAPKHVITCSWMLQLLHAMEEHVGISKDVHVHVLMVTIRHVPLDRLQLRDEFRVLPQYRFNALRLGRSARLLSHHVTSFGKLIQRSYRIVCVPSASGKPGGCDTLRIAEGLARVPPCERRDPLRRSSTATPHRPGGRSAHRGER